MTQRELANESGYSLAGAHRAIESLVTGGIIAKLARRGRKGWTRLVLRAGAHVLKASELNVPERGTPYLDLEREPVAMFGNIYRGAGLQRLFGDNGAWSDRGVSVAKCAPA